MQGDLKPERVYLFKQLLEMGEKYKHESISMSEGLSSRGVESSVGDSRLCLKWGKTQEGNLAATK